jgi:hypothetical protein
MEKVAYLLSTVTQMDTALNDADITERLERLYDTIAHTAPEIIDSRWHNIYRFCTTFVTDGENANHIKCFELYNKRVKEYKQLF